MSTISSGSSGLTWTSDNSSNLAITLTSIVDNTGNTVTGSTVVKGAAKAWVRFNGATATMNSAFNVSSVARNATGDYTINFITPMASGEYAVASTAGDNQNAVSSTPTYVRPTKHNTANVKIGVGYASGGTQALYDYDNISLTVFGN